MAIADRWIDGIRHAARIVRRIIVKDAPFRSAQVGVVHHAFVACGRNKAAFPLVFFIGKPLDRFIRGALQNGELRLHQLRNANAINL